MFRDRLFAGIPSLVASAGFFLHVVIHGRKPASLEDAIGRFTWPWLIAIVIACAINGVLALLPARYATLQLESATRWVAITLMAGFAVASWSGHGRAIQGILAFTVACWHFSRWWSIRRQLHDLAKANVIRAQLEHQEKER